MTTNITEHGTPRRTESTGALVPANMTEALSLAQMMADSRLVPEHLQNAPADCFLVIEQATRWKMSPFAVGQCTSVIKGKLMFEGKLVAAAVQNSGLLAKRLRYAFTGSGDSLTVTVTGTIRGEDKPSEVVVPISTVATNNDIWKRQPQQQLCYAGARVWARRHAPEVMLGVYTPEEFPEPEASAPRGERDVTPPREQPQALPHYPAENFNNNFDSWANAIKHGKKTPEQIIAMVSTKGVLSTDQCEQIRALAPTTEGEEA